MSKQGTGITLDPVTFEVLKNSFITAVDQMAEQVRQDLLLLRGLQPRFLVGALRCRGQFTVAQGNQGHRRPCRHAALFTCKAVIDTLPGRHAARRRVHHQRSLFRRHPFQRRTRLIRPDLRRGDEIIAFAASPTGTGPTCRRQRAGLVRRDSRKDMFKRRRPHHANAHHAPRGKFLQATWPSIIAATTRAIQFRSSVTWTSQIEATRRGRARDPSARREVRQGHRRAPASSRSAGLCRARRRGSVSPSCPTVPGRTVDHIDRDPAAR